MHVSKIEAEDFLRDSQKHPDAKQTMREPQHLGQFSRNIPPGMCVINISSQ